MIARRRCAEEILEALKELGPSTVDMISLTTGIKKKDLRQSLTLIRRRGLVDMLVGDGRTFFYQLNQSMSARREIAERISCHETDTIKPLLRRQDRYHNQWCEYWSLILRRTFPDVKVVRDYSIGSHEISRNVLLLEEFDYDLLPDFLAIFPGSDGREVAIAFEIERTRKSEKRLLRKFRRYLEETRVDGLVYVCDSGRLAETLRALYQSRLINKCERVKHYAQNFFLFSHSLSALSTPLASFINVNADHVLLEDWCETLCTKNRSHRRDADFKHA